MKLVEGETRLIVAGAWNPAIVTPGWIGRHVLEYPLDHVFNVAVEMPMAAIVPALQPRYSFESLILQVTRQGLHWWLTPADPEQCKKTLQVAAKILSLLAHTPVSGAGINFAFQAEGLEPDLATRFDVNSDLSSLIEEESASLVARSFSGSIKVNDRIINVECKSADSGVRVEVNVHHEVTSAAACAQTLSSPDVFETARQYAVRLAKGITREDLVV